MSDSDRLLSNHVIDQARPHLHPDHFAGSPAEYTPPTAGLARVADRVIGSPSGARHSASECDLDGCEGALECSHAASRGEGASHPALPAVARRLTRHGGGRADEGGQGWGGGVLGPGEDERGGLGIIDGDSDQVAAELAADGGGENGDHAAQGDEVEKLHKVVDLGSV